MSSLLLKFFANFVAIITFAIVVDSYKDRLACYLNDDPEITVNGIHMMNTTSLAFASAINAYACFSQRSSHLLTVVGLAYLSNLVVFGIASRAKQHENGGTQ